ncbi:DUF5987 family protein [Saccharopolyspora indica]|uniref:DUF5987 family protein n=1 Tax=Saccharopolyspora indica TaxID=1229659 RepID=UPI0022EAD05F|nr:DUF5987 family protein [Saccharopolyspora indica]MDA3646990.1 DUF5987 family protein [Saccharopolyspora indica]
MPVQPSGADDREHRVRTTTLEAFADTILPGAKRSADDPAVAGVAADAGSVEAGAIELLEWSATGVHDGLDFFATTLNERAAERAAERGTGLDPSVPAFAALDHADRRALVAELTSPGHPEKEFWVSLALFCNMAFDSAAHLHTAEAIAAGHPGLAAMGISNPDADGLWRFPAYSYGRKLAEPHPDTTPSGSPA